MKAIRNGFLSVALSAVVAWVFVHAGAPWFDFWGWFAFLLACSVVNALTISPRPAGEKGPGPRVSFMTLPSTHAQHAPRLDKLREPPVLAILVTLALVVAWLLVRLVVAS